MSLRLPDMDDCCPKKKCLSGVNTGRVYNTCEPCTKGTIFDPEECDCYAPTAWKRINAFWSIKRTGTGFYGGANDFINPGWYNGNLRTSLYGGYDKFVYLNAAFFSSSTACNGRTWSTETSKNGVFHYSYIVSDSGTGLTGENEDFREACIWPEDCYAVQYGENKPEGCLTYTVTGYIIGTVLEYDEEIERFVEVSYLLYDDLDREDPAYAPWQHEQIDARTRWAGPAPAVGSNGINVNCDCNPTGS